MLRAIVCLPTWRFCKELCTEPGKVLSSKSAQALRRAGKAVMGASRNQAGGHRGGRGGWAPTGWGALGRGSALRRGTCPAPGGQWHTPLNSALRGQVWQGQNLASLLDSCLRAVSVLAVVLGCRKTASGPGRGEEGFPEGASPDRDAVGVSALTLSPRAETLLFRCFSAHCPFPGMAEHVRVDPALGAASSSWAPPPTSVASVPPQSRGGGGITDAPPRQVRKEGAAWGYAG